MDGVWGWEKMGEQELDFSTSQVWLLIPVTLFLSLRPENYSEFEASIDYAANSRQTRLKNRFSLNPHHNLFHLFMKEFVKLVFIPSA